MKFSTIIVTLFALFNWSVCFAQGNLLGELQSDVNEPLFVQPAFKAMKIANLQSTKIASKGDLYMYVSHRFGSLKGGFDTFYGLDNAITKIQLVYGFTDKLQLGLSRESLRKTFSASAKYKLKEQGKSLMNITAYTTVNYNSELSFERYPYLQESDRLSYASQLLFSYRFSSEVSLLLAPSYVRQNLVWEPSQSHDQYALGLGARYKITKRSSINADYMYHLNRNEASIYSNTLSVGMDIETGGHVFQLLFSNAQSTNEPGFISNAEGDWTTGDVYFGFNIVRVF